jgi:methylmalonyl-CoA mutase N-terminal domain/subunit
MRDRFGARNPRSMMLRFHTQTAGSSLTAQQPDINVIRTSLQALAAVLGGTQSLHTNARDEALSLPTEESARLALRTQQIIAYESGVTNTADPAGGSQLIESLTDQIEQGALEYLARIDTMGGTLRAIETGYIQGEIQNAAFEYQKAVERGDQIVVGVNRFQMQAGAIPRFRLDPALEQSQIDRLRQARAGRDTTLTTRCLQELEQAARGTENLMPRILAAAGAYATVGEISDRLRTVFGEYCEAA